YKGEYFRDYPYKGDFLDVYYLLYVMGASNFKQLLTAFILKWMYEERIIVDPEKAGYIHKYNVATIYFCDHKMEKESLEGELFHMMLGAAGSDDSLTESKFRTWTETNRKKLIQWEKDVINRSLQKLRNAEYIELQKQR